MKRNITMTADEWAAGELTLIKWRLAGSPRQSYMNTGAAAFVMLQTAERIVNLAAATLESGPEGIITVPPFQKVDVSGRRKFAELYGVTDPYLAAIGAAKLLYNSGRQVSSITTPAAVQVKQLAPGLTLPLALPFAVIAWGAVGMAAVIGATYFGVDKNTKVAEIKKFAIIAEVQQYLKTYETALAAGVTPPGAPDHIRPIITHEKQQPFLIAGVGAVAGAVALAGAYKFFARPKATPVRVVNPVRRRLTSSRRALPSASIKRVKRATRKAATLSPVKRVAKKTAPRNPKKKKANPSTWTSPSTGLYVRGPYRIRPIGGRWAVLYQRKVVGESDTLAGAKRIAGRSPRKALYRNPKKKDAPKRRKAAAPKRKRNPKKKAAPKRRQVKKAKSNPRKWKAPSGDTSRAVFMRRQQRGGASKKQAIARWNFKRQAKKRSKPRPKASGAARRRHNPRETFMARAGTKAGLVDLGESDTVKGAQELADRETDDRETEVLIRGEYTSEGAHWPDHGGRLVSVRRGGKWARYNPAKKYKARTVKLAGRLGTYKLTVPAGEYDDTYDVFSPSGDHIGRVVEQYGGGWFAMGPGDRDQHGYTGRYLTTRSVKTRRHAVEIVAGVKQGNPRGKRFETEGELVAEWNRLQKRYDAAWDRIGRGEYKGDRQDAIDRAEKYQERIAALDAEHKERWFEAHVPNPKVNAPLGGATRRARAAANTAAP